MCVVYFKGCSSFSFFCSFMMPSDLISNTASYVVSSMIQTGLLAATFLQSCFLYFPFSPLTVLQQKFLWLLPLCL